MAQIIQGSSSAYTNRGYFDVGVVDKLSSRKLVVCQIVVGQGNATGFLIGRNLVMTNHHVLPDEATARKAQAVFFYTQGNAQVVQVDFDPDSFFCTSPAPDSLGFEPLTSKYLDFTIVAIKPHSQITEISHLAFSIFDTPNPPIDIHANIIHHPLEQDGTSYQKVSFRNNFVKEVSQFTLHYTTTTMPGSSGAPVMDDEGNLIALHRATCTHLLKALLEENVLTALLTHLFPGLRFAEGSVHQDGKEHKGRCVTVEGSTLFIFTKGDWKGLYWHNDKMRSPASLFELIKTKHAPAKEWVTNFLKEQDVKVEDYHRECNTAIFVSSIYKYLQDYEWTKLFKIRNKYDAVQKNHEENSLHRFLHLPLVLTSILNSLEIVVKDDRMMAWVAANALREIAVRGEKENIYQILAWAQTALNNKEPNVRLVATITLWKIAESGGEKIIPPILVCAGRAMTDKEAIIRSTALVVLGKLVAHFGVFAQLLTWVQTALSDDEPSVRIAAAETLLQIAKHGREQILPQISEYIEKGLNDKDLNVRSIAVKILGEVVTLGGETTLPQVLKFLGKMLVDEEFNVRREASDIFSELAKHGGGTIISQILAHLDWNNPDPDKFWNTTMVLMNIVPHAGEKNIQQILDWIQVTLKHEHPTMLSSAANVLEEIADHIKKENVSQTLECIRTVLSDKDFGRRFQASKALGKLGLYVDEKNISQIMKYFEIALNDKDSSVQGAAKDALCQLVAKIENTYIPPFLNWLFIALKDPKFHMRVTAIETLKVISTRAEKKDFSKILDALQMALKDKSPHIRKVIITALGRIAIHGGNDSINRILDSIKSAQNDQDPDVRQVAIDTFTYAMEDIKHQIS